MSAEMYRWYRYALSITGHRLVTLSTEGSVGQTVGLEALTSEADSGLSGRLLLARRVLSQSLGLTWLRSDGDVGPKETSFIMPVVRQIVAPASQAFLST